MKNIARSIFVFRRDLRVYDNTALLAAMRASESVIPVFVLDSRQCRPHQYFSINAVGFLIESLFELRQEIAEQGGQLVISEGVAEEIIPDLAKRFGASSVFVNKDYTPFSRRRDRELAQRLEGAGIGFHSFSDALLLEPSEFSKADGKPYTVFTPFYKKASTIPVRSPSEPSERLRFAKPDSALGDWAPADLNKYFAVGAAAQRVHRGGRKEGLKLLQRLSERANYDRERDYPALAATTLLSPHNKFGTLSIREVYREMARHFGKECTLIRELYWRDFFTHIAWHFPHVFESSFQAGLDALEWSNNDEHFEAWCQGRTGFPIVDAGMRELIATGNMHNRVRMIVASFLVKDLHVNWRRGEAFFARHLTDYDPSVNNGSWQWAASTGCDAQPYFRIFNPWLQQAKFDPQCSYIKRWVPELAAVYAKNIHALADDDCQRAKGYPAPIVDHAIEKEVTLEAFEKVRRKLNK